MQQLTTLLPNSNHCSPVGCMQQISTFPTPQINFPDPNPETWKFSVEQKLQANHFNSSLENTPALEISDRRDAPCLPRRGLRDFPRKDRPFLRPYFVLCPHSEDAGGDRGPAAPATSPATASSSLPPAAGQHTRSTAAPLKSSPRAARRALRCHFLGESFPSETMALLPACGHCWPCHSVTAPGPA